MKLQLVLRGDRRLSYADFEERLRDAIAPRLLALDPQGLKLTYTAGAMPRISVIPFSRDRLAVISIWLRDGAPDPRAWRAAAGNDLAVSAYVVEESVPVEYERDWPDGEATPGVGLLTLFNRKPGLDDATFIERWHGGHTPFSLRVHPLWLYIRNVVREAVQVEGSAFEAIVEEHFRERRLLLNPARFFGGPLAMLPNMIRTWLDVRGFIDMTSIEVFLTREVHLRSGGADVG